MQYRTHRVFGLVVCLAVTAGCAAKRPAGTDSDSWTWDKYAASVLRQDPRNAASAQVSTPQPKAVSAHPDEFAFSHPRVDDFVTQFQTNLRGFYSRALERSSRYVPRMSSILHKKGLPEELAYLPLIESGFSPHAVSRAGAVGPWQLIPGTGRRYGLRIDRYVDERRDPVKSTQAAASYLKDLHDMFGDWHLSLAAYNTGEQNIVRILERRRADDFWQMSERGYLYQETCNFVPEFLAALHIAESPQAYGFDTPTGVPVKYDMIKVQRSLSLSTVAHLSGASVDEIKELNPALQRGVIPPNGYAVRLPKGSKESFEVALANLPVSADVRDTPGRSVHHRARSRHQHRGHHHPTKGAAHVVASGHDHQPQVLAARHHSRSAAVD